MSQDTEPNSTKNHDFSSLNSLENVSFQTLSSAAESVRPKSPPTENPENLLKTGGGLAEARDSDSRTKSSLRIRYEAEVKMIRRKLGDLEQIRSTLGLSQRKMSQLLFVDPSAWTRWTRAGEQAPPHIYRMLQWYLALEEKYPALDTNFWLSAVAKIRAPVEDQTELEILRIEHESLKQLVGQIRENAGREATAAAESAVKKLSLDRVGNADLRGNAHKLDFVPTWKLRLLVFGAIALSFLIGFIFAGGLHH